MSFSLQRPMTLTWLQAIPHFLKDDFSSILCFLFWFYVNLRHKSIITQLLNVNRKLIPSSLFLFLIQTPSPGSHPKYLDNLFLLFGNIKNLSQDMGIHWTPWNSDRWGFAMAVILIRLASADSAVRPAAHPPPLFLKNEMQCNGTSWEPSDSRAAVGKYFCLHFGVLSHTCTYQKQAWLYPMQAHRTRKLSPPFHRPTYMERFHRPE